MKGQHRGSVSTFVRAQFRNVAVLTFAGGCRGPLITFSAYSSDFQIKLTQADQSANETTATY